MRHFYTYMWWPDPLVTLIQHLAVTQSFVQGTRLFSDKSLATDVTLWGGNLLCRELFRLHGESGFGRICSKDHGRCKAKHVQA